MVFQFVIVGKNLRPGQTTSRGNNEWWRHLCSAIIPGEYKCTILQFCLYEVVNTPDTNGIMVLGEKQAHCTASRSFMAAVACNWNCVPHTLINCKLQARRCLTFWVRSRVDTCNVAAPLEAAQREASRSSPHREKQPAVCQRAAGGRHSGPLEDTPQNEKKLPLSAGLKK